MDAKPQTVGKLAGVDCCGCNLHPALRFQRPLFDRDTLRNLPVYGGYRMEAMVQDSERRFESIHRRSFLA